MLEGFVKINSKRVCFKHLNGKIGEIFGYWEKPSGTIIYGVSHGSKDYEFFEYELEEINKIN